MKKYIRDSKMRSQLKGAAMTIEPVLSIGKNSLTPEFIDAVRENIVKNELIKKHGIAADRIITKAMGDTEQPYDDAILNRVAICVVE